ncbi:MAG: Rpn family recombination-promoting nuclease/putative transposase [Leptospiraceae bacterium]|nr:Rpn family recombination-promoting nuclease/putative transposase [Leptospiraceae bacterium]
MKLIPFTDNFIFKAIFSQNPDLLLDLLNSFPEFQKSKRIEKGNSYSFLPKVYSINFVNFDMFQSKQYHHVFLIQEKKNPEIILTEDLEIHTIELTKIESELLKINSDFESWLFALKQGHTLKGEEMNTLTKKNPKLKKVFKEYKEYSLNPKNRNYIEARKKSELDKNASLLQAKNEGIEEGMMKGKLEGKLETSIKLLDFGMTLEQVSKITGLSSKEILNYKKKSKS